MANSYIELAAQSGGVKLDSESLTVASEPVERQRSQIAGSIDVAIADVVAAASAVDVYGLRVRQVPQRSAVSTFQSAQVLNATTFHNSSAFDSSPYSRAVVYVEIHRAANPQALRVIPQFSDDDETSWHSALDLEWIYTDISALPTGSPGLRVAFLLPYLGRDFRIRIEGEGTDGSNTLTVTTAVEFIV